MYCASFVFTPGDYDEEFHRLNTAIDTYAKSLDGYIKVESWQSISGAERNSMYYFKDLESIKNLANLPAHQKAKNEVDSWYEDYRIEIFEITETYGKNNPKLS